MKNTKHVALDINPVAPAAATQEPFFPAKSKRVEFVTNAHSTDNSPDAPEFLRVTLTSQFFTQLVNTRSLLRSGEFESITLGEKAARPDLYWGPKDVDETVPADTIIIRSFGENAEVVFRGTHGQVEDAEYFSRVDSEVLSMSFLTAKDGDVVYFSDEGPEHEQVLRHEHEHDQAANHADNDRGRMTPR